LAKGGIEGITAEYVNNLMCNNSVIGGCTYSIMTTGKAILSFNKKKNEWRWKAIEIK